MHALTSVAVSSHKNYKTTQLINVYVHVEAENKKSNPFPHQPSIPRKPYNLSYNSCMRHSVYLTAYDDHFLNIFFMQCLWLKIIQYQNCRLQKTLVEKAFSVRLSDTQPAIIISQSHSKKYHPIASVLYHYLYFTKLIIVNLPITFVRII